ncbi:hypothetical protein GCM10010168_36160 [Actinoplanes ianthinogenes]|uniref:TetR family transcriptional regulator n=1 Tax=Actinoplanes ianthinogenes TaxID=122358 RepID=A0ABM7M5D4_9ACTN|nr:hypothetical protein [Actinoplanes ianthinogenes]BCJ46862.1 hypothetical protein Aiant_75190 [Actinoplanes ianthinogenes]GGR14994.1 hypothetical protein GCM10010168_36160 [Actinoplanes ianthinogenes]
MTRDYAREGERAIAGVLEGTDPELPRAVHAAYNGALVTWGMTEDGSPAGAVRSQLRRSPADHPGA